MTFDQVTPMTRPLLVAQKRETSRETTELQELLAAVSVGISSLFKTSKFIRKFVHQN